MESKYFDPHESNGDKIDTYHYTNILPKFNLTWVT